MRGCLALFTLPNPFFSRCFFSKEHNIFHFCNQHISKLSGYISSTHYPSFYTNVSNCSTYINAESGQVITFEIVDLDLKPPRVIQEKRFKHEKEITECTDKLVILNQTNELATVCNQESYKKKFVIKAYPLEIKFDAKDYFNNFRGFLARFRSKFGIVYL
jgi:CUB domain